MASHVIKNNAIQIFFAVLCFLTLTFFFLKADILFQIQQPFSATSLISSLWNQWLIQFQQMLNFQLNLIGRHGRDWETITRKQKDMIRSGTRSQVYRNKVEWKDISVFWDEMRSSKSQLSIILYDNEITSLIDIYFLRVRFIPSDPFRYFYTLFILPINNVQPF